MEDKFEKIKKIENYVDFLSECLSSGMANISVKESNQNYEQDRKRIEYQYFISAGDYHYFIARVLFLNMIGEYAFFCGQQCIENYLKAYLKFTNHFPKKDYHDLNVLLSLCRDIDTKNEFINSERVNTIIVRFNSFYELARYPVQKSSRPKNGQYAFLFPDDIKPLDYFVYQMRKIMPYPNNMFDLLKKGALQSISEIAKNDNLSEIFKRDNINFMQ